MRAVEVDPVEVVVGVEVGGFLGAAGCVVAGAAARVREDSVGEGDFLEFGVRSRFVFVFGFVCGGWLVGRGGGGRGIHFTWVVL